MFSVHLSLARFGAVVSLVGVAAITGCGVGVQDAAAPAATPGRMINGNVHGGAWPIQGATIRLMETQSNGYGGAARQLLQTTSDSNGYFTFPDTGWSCDAGQYAYVTVSSGHTGSNLQNNKVVQVGVIGGCSTDLATQSEIDGVNVFVSELSTVAAAYALGNFISIDSTDASSGEQIVNISAPANNNVLAPACTGTGAAMACTAAGLAHAFGNASDLVDSVRYDGTFPSGKANSTLLNKANSQAIMPQEMINALGNILQSCVDSAGGATAESTGSSGQAVYTTDGTRCGDLFSNAAPPSGYANAGNVTPGTTPPANTPPTNTLQAVMNMAKYPTNNVVNLFDLQPRAVFFTPNLNSATLAGTTTPIALTLSVFYQGTGLAGSNGQTQSVPYPVDVVLDPEDNAYVLYADAGPGSSTYGAIDALTANGAGLFNGSAQTALANPTGVALDNLGHAWVTSDTPTGDVIALSTGAGGGSIDQDLPVANHYAAGVATDQSNNVWVTRDASDSNQSLFLFSAANAYTSAGFSTTPALNKAMQRLVVDAAQNVWAVTSDTSPAFVVLFPYAASTASTKLYSAQLGSSGGFGLAVNNALKVFLPLSGELDSAAGLTNGTLYTNLASSAAGQQAGITGSGSPSTTMVDGNGTIFWTDNEASGQVLAVIPSGGQISNGSLLSFTPCFVVNQQCHVPTSGTLLRGMAIDSSGAMWYVSDGSDYPIAQTLGLAAPTWPLLSYARGGVPVQ